MQPFLLINLNDMKTELHQHVNLLTDFGFKRFFGTEPYKDNLIHFLNTFLAPYIGHITDIRYRPTEQLGLSDKEKRVVYDVYCTNQEDDHVIVEMQQEDQKFMKNRMIAYSSRIISNSLKVGDRKYDIPTVITIVLANFRVAELTGRDDFVQYVTLKDEQNNIFSKKVAFLLIDLSKFAAQMQFDQLADDRARWCYTIRNMERMEESAIPVQYGMFRKLCEDCRITKLNVMEKQEYEKSVLEYEDVKDAMAYQREKGIEEGRAEGRAEGIKEGMEKGRANGIKEGIKEGILQTAKNLLKMGISISDVMKATGLSEEEVRKLKSEN